MRDVRITTDFAGNGLVRKLSRREMPLLREHLLRLDSESRRDRFNGFADESFIERYAEKCQADGTIVIAYLDDGMVMAAAELHPPGGGLDSTTPEIAFSVERHLRRNGLGSLLFKRLIAEARLKGYVSLRITTGAQNDAMRALASKFGAHLTFRHGESTGLIDLRRQPSSAAQPIAASAADLARTVIDFNHACWKLTLRMYGLDRVA
jgi:GNAT superfamily N-acetyltransferase